MLQHSLQSRNPTDLPTVIAELRAAHERLGRLFEMLGDSLDELTERCDSAPCRAANEPFADPMLPEFDQSVGHALAALHYENRAGQLFDLTMNRLGLARAALKKSGIEPIIRGNTQVWGAGISTCADLR